MTAVVPSHPIASEAARSARSDATRFARAAGGRRRLAGRAVTAAVAVGAFGLLSTACTPQQIAEGSINKYFATAYQACASKIVARESNYQADAISPDGKNIGLFQINAVHTAWIKTNYGYTFASLTDADKNAQVAKGLSDAALSYYKDRWQPWRLDGKPRTDGSCPA